MKKKNLKKIYGQDIINLAKKKYDKRKSKLSTIGERRLLELGLVCLN